MPSRRQRKVAELLHEELGLILQFDTRDPRLGFVTITGVEIDPDLRLAKVYITVLGDEDDAQETLEGLASATGYFRRKLSQSLSLRRVPDLAFMLDHSLEAGLRIEQLLDTIKEGDDRAENAAEDEPER